MVDIELAEEVMDAEIVLGVSEAVVSNSLDPDGHGAGYDAGYVAELVKALKVLRGSYAE